MGLLGRTILSRAYKRVGPLYQLILGDFSSILSPVEPDIDTNEIFSGL
jgi:hypothetical protein